MAIQTVSSRRLSKAAAIVIAFLATAGVAVWYSRGQGWALIFELSILMFLFIAFAIVYDRIVIR